MLTARSTTSTQEERWQERKKEYRQRFGVGGHTILFAFRGTLQQNEAFILKEGFKLSKVSTGERGRRVEYRGVARYAYGVVTGRTAHMPHHGASFYTTCRIAELLQWFFND